MIKLNYKQFMKHAEKVTKKTSRPALKGVNHSDDGTLSVTDSHRLYRAYNVNAPKNVLLDAVTGDEISETYPEFKGIIPEDADAAEVFTANTKELKAVLKAMEPAGRVDGTKTADIQVNIINNSIKLVNSAGIDYNYELDSGAQDIENIDILFNLQFLLEAVELMEDIKAQHIIIRYYSDLKPVTIKPDCSNDILALILPMRPY